MDTLIEIIADLPPVVFTVCKIIIVAVLISPVLLAWPDVVAALDRRRARRLKRLYDAVPCEGRCL